MGKRGVKKLRSVIGIRTNVSAMMEWRYRKKNRRKRGAIRLFGNICAREINGDRGIGDCCSSDQTSKELSCPQRKDPTG